MPKSAQTRPGGLSGKGAGPGTSRADTQAKTRPLQQRSRQTYEAILAAAASLLEEVGIDHLSTNLICARAKLTPPALYRYFPNKYALLRELGIRLMHVQDQAVFAWIEEGGLVAATTEEAFAKTVQIQLRLNAVTRAQPAALWVARAMRAVPVLREVRIESRERVAEAMFAGMRPFYENTSEATLRCAIRLNLELASAAIEMILEEPKTGEQEIVNEFSWMTVRYFSRLT